MAGAELIPGFCRCIAQHAICANYIGALWQQDSQSIYETLESSPMCVRAALASHGTGLPPGLSDHVCMPMSLYAQ